MRSNAGISNVAKADLLGQLVANPADRLALEASWYRLQWQGEDALFRWLSSIARHVVLEHAAGRKRERPATLDDGLLATDPTQSRVHRRQERFDRLQGALDDLSPEQQKVVYLARIERVPIKEIARRMGRTPNSVSHVLLRALQKLRERFGDTESLGLPDVAFREPGPGDDE